MIARQLYPHLRDELQIVTVETRSSPAIALQYDLDHVGCEHAPFRHPRRDIGIIDANVGRAQMPVHAKQQSLLKFKGINGLLRLTATATKWNRIIFLKIERYRQ